MATDPPILDLSTLIARPKIAIDGTLFEIRSPDELSILDSLYFARAGRDIDRLESAGDQPEEYERLIGDVARNVLVDVPEAVIAKLSGIQLQSIVEVFIELLLEARMRTAGARKGPLAQAIRAALAVTRGDDAGTATKTTGATSSPGSSASTAALSASGSATRRSASSGPAA